MTAIMKFEGKFSFVIYSEDFLHTYPHKYAYNSNTVNAIIIISSDSDSTINSRLKKHVFRKIIFYQFFFISGYCARLRMALSNIRDHLLCPSFLILTTISRVQVKGFGKISVYYIKGFTILNHVRPVFHTN